MDEKLEKLKRHTASFIGMENCSKSAVCIPLLKAENDYHVLFEVRSEKIGRQPGDICLPGGMVEPGETPEQAAMRETMEELLISEKQMRLIGAMDVLWTHSLLVYPYVSILEAYQGSYSRAEVAETFQVPLSFFVKNQPEIYHTKMEVIPQPDFPYEKIAGGRQYHWRERTEEIYFYEYENRAIWGMTARIMAAFAGLYRAI